LRQNLTALAEVRLGSDFTLSWSVRRVPNTAHCEHTARHTAPMQARWLTRRQRWPGRRLRVSSRPALSFCNTSPPNFCSALS